MEHFLAMMFAKHLEHVLKKKPQVLWIIQAPAGPLIVWLSARAIIFEAFGRLGNWEQLIWMVAGFAGICFSYLSIVHLIAWTIYIATGSKDPSAVKHPAPNPDSMSEPDWPITHKEESKRAADARQ